MGYSINPVEEEQCLCLSYAGEMPPREIAAAASEAYGLLTKKEWCRIRVDVSQLRSVLTGVQVFDFAEGLAAQVPRNVRLALVVRPDQIQDACLVKKIARADGVCLGWFIDPEDAALWVRHTTAKCRHKVDPLATVERQGKL